MRKILTDCTRLGQVIAILTGFHLGDPEWKELTDDGMAWTSPVLIIIVVAFLHNLIKYRHSKSLTSPSHLEQQQHHQAIRLSRTPSISPRTAFFGTFSNNLQDTKVDLPVKDEDEEGQIDASEQMERKRSLAGLGISVIENPQFRFNDDSYGRIATEAKEGRRLPLT